MSLAASTTRSSKLQTSKQTEQQKQQQQQIQHFFSKLPALHGQWMCLPRASVAIRWLWLSLAPAAGCRFMELKATSIELIYASRLPHGYVY